MINAKWKYKIWDTKNISGAMPDTSVSHDGSVSEFLIQLIEASNLLVLLP